VTGKGKSLANLLCKRGIRRFWVEPTGYPRTVIRAIDNRNATHRGFANDDRGRKAGACTGFNVADSFALNCAETATAAEMAVTLRARFLRSRSRAWASSRWAGRHTGRA
jgi:hypothetical protein